MHAIIAAERVEHSILLEKVMLDLHLAPLYGVPTRTLNQAVRRNRARFPADFMFQLTWDEVQSLRSQFVTLSGAEDEILRSQSVILRHGQHRKFRPYAFTEQGVAMLSSVLRSKRAAQVNVEIMRAFVRLRGMLAAHRDLAAKLDALERKYDGQFAVVFEAIRQLMEPPDAPAVEEGKKPRIGFRRAQALKGIGLGTAPDRWRPNKSKARSESRD